MKTFFNNVQNIDLKIWQTMRFGITLYISISLLVFYAIYCYLLNPINVTFYNCCISLLKTCLAGILAFLTFGLVCNKIIHK